MLYDISESIRYIGVDDKTLDLFESQYIIPDGVSYNSHLILDEKIAVMDSVDTRKEQEWLENLRTELKGATPDYLVLSHIEPDHSGGVKLLLETYPEMKIVGNAKTFTFLSQFIDNDLTDRCHVVKEQDELSLGEHTLKFYMAPMIHWPEVMVSYDLHSKTLFSADAFGRFGALDVEMKSWSCEARRYYFNIVGKYGANVQALLKKLAGVDIERIAPLHGPTLSGDLTPYLTLYNTWSTYEPECDGVLVAYASIHGNTAKAAKMFAQKLEEMGQKDVVLFDLSRDDMAEAIEAAFENRTIVLAAASYDAGVFPPMEDFLHHLKSKNFQKRRIAIIENGSWAPTAAKTMRAILEGMKALEIYENNVTIRSCYKAENDADLEQMAKWIININE